MSCIRIHKNFEPQTTEVSNLFIDEYLPYASGDFVKVYLSLIRAENSGQDLDLSALAYRLSFTEGDIFRALKYWESKGLLTMESKGSEITALSLTMPARKPASAARSQAEPQKAAESPQKNSSSDMTLDRVAELKQDHDVSMMLFTAEQYLGKALTLTEIKKLLSFHEDLGLPPKLIEYLIESCVNKNHKSIYYMEKVAAAWAESGITTITQAREASVEYNKDYYAILRSMGITNRSPIPDEIRLMDKWLNQYGFDLSIIDEACSRTVMNTGQPGFHYADRILTEWNSLKVHSLSDIKSLDQKYLSRQYAAQNRKNASAKQSTGNRFQNFEQRSNDYSDF